MNLRETRISYHLSQIDASIILGVPIRTYRRYENDNSYGDAFKRKMFIDSLKKQCEITEEKGILTIEQIKKIVTDVFETKYKGKIDFCYLFGSYAKGTAKDRSDVDLYLFSSLTGLDFVGCIEDLRQALHKKVDLIRSSELKNNIDLMNEILKGGIKIYG